MQILSLNFSLYTISGLWRPIEWSSRCSKLLYGIFTTCTLYLIFFLLLSQLLDIILVIDNLDDFVTNSLTCLSVISVACKMVVAVIRRDDIINVLQILQNKPHKVCNKEEIDIQMKFDRIIRSLSISFLLLCTVSATGAVTGGVLETLEGRLPLRGWVPWDCTSLFLFWFTSFQEILAVILGTIMNVATETIVLGFCLQICAQFEILKYRLQTVVKSSEKKNIAESLLNDAPSKSDRLSEHISHHLCIVRLAEMINNLFSQVIFVQFFVSIVVLCSSLYYLSSHTKLSDIAPFVAYTIAMFLQIFVYCWAGNEVIIKSIDLGNAVYETDWLFMTISERKDLLMIMMRSTRPIKFTSSFLVTLSLNSYSNLLKTSYSVFNVLKQS